MAKTEGTSILYYTHDTIIMFPSSTCELNYTFVQEPEEQKNGIHMYRTHAGESTFRSPLACSSHCHCKVCAVYTDSAATHATRVARTYAVYRGFLSYQSLPALFFNLFIVLYLCSGTRRTAELQHIYIIHLGLSSVTVSL